MDQTSRARLFKEYKEVHREKGGDNDIQLTCDDTNIYRWTAYIKVLHAIYHFLYCLISMQTCLDMCLNQSVFKLVFRELYVSMVVSCIS